MAPPAAAATSRLMSRLPEELQVEIFLKLPAKSIVSCKCVCKLWLNLISSPKFIDDHLNLSIQNKKNHKIMFADKESLTGKPLIYSIDYDSISSSPDLSCEYIGNESILMDYPFEYKEGMKIRILGSCNGLICFGLLIDTKTSICIWNPTTREYKHIPDSVFGITLNCCPLSIAGFGYDSKTGDYKIVVVANPKQPDYCEVEVYTFGSHSTKTMKTIPNKFPTHVLFSGVFINGALHWINNSRKQGNSSYNLVSFDISNEKLMDVALPKESIILSNTELYQKLGVFGDCLSLVLVDKRLTVSEVWVMHDYGVRESWTKLFTTTTERPNTRHLFWTPMLSLKNGKILMYTYAGFVLWDPMNKRVGELSSFFQRNTFKDRIDAMIMTHPESYVESLVSLNSGTCVKKPKGQNTRDVE